MNSQAPTTEPDRGLAEPKLYIVCLLDVLGFENILKTVGISTLYAKYQGLIEHVRGLHTGFDIVQTHDGHLVLGVDTFHSAYFSDTLLFWTPYYSGAMGLILPAFLPRIADAICFGIENALPLRGAIAVGEVVIDEAARIFLGYPLVEVARTERTQRWIGASFGPSFLSPPHNAGLPGNAVLPYRSQYKETAEEYMTGVAVDWPRRWRENRKSDPRPAIRALDVAPSFSEYYEKTLKFVDYSQEKHDWFRRQPQLEAI